MRVSPAVQVNLPPSCSVNVGLQTHWRSAVGKVLLAGQAVQILGATPRISSWNVDPSAESVRNVSFECWKEGNDSGCAHLRILI